MRCSILLIALLAALPAYAEPTTPMGGTGGTQEFTLGTSPQTVCPEAKRQYRASVTNTSTTARVFCRLGSTAATGVGFPVNPVNTTNFADRVYVPGDFISCVSDTAGTPVTAWCK